MPAEVPNLNALTEQFAASPTVATLREIIQFVEPYCFRTRYPRYNQAAVAATVFERTRDDLNLPASILTDALKAEACWDCWGRK